MRNLLLQVSVFLGCLVVTWSNGDPPPGQMLSWLPGWIMCFLAILILWAARTLGLLMRARPRRALSCLPSLWTFRTSLLG
ncbi:UNVERIFIED_CONTAM: hypothetical protein Sradi_1633700 [Sesamum radiatum]|uniref:Uncharacterized protein n=1 Tax=Sesamum radiatum TaxID=300843 RepID=A0AAW2UBP4_SESRA